MHLFTEEHGEIWGRHAGLGNKSYNISETHKHRGKVAMGGPEAYICMHLLNTPDGSNTHSTIIKYNITRLLSVRKGDRAMRPI